MNTFLGMEAKVEGVIAVSMLAAKSLAANESEARESINADAIQHTHTHTHTHMHACTHSAKRWDLVRTTFSASRASDHSHERALAFHSHELALTCHSHDGVVVNRRFHVQRIPFVETHIRRCVHKGAGKEPHRDVRDAVVLQQAVHVGKIKRA
jgi:hypothetical protein